jgi:cytochrome c oxidase cbb3-type subunit 3
MSNDKESHEEKKYGEDTGHSWDGIKELKNPPPRWWMIGLHASWIYLLVYFILYPSIPLINGSNKGILGWTQIKEYKEGLEKSAEIQAPYLSKISTMSAKEILADPEMRHFINQSTKAVFGDRCSGCHGMGGQGLAGQYPNLNDDDWLYGGDIETIVETITDGRESFMPAQIDILEESQINSLADFVVALSEGKATANGWNLYKESGCTTCHGNNAKGGLANDNFSGAVNLTDKIYRFGGTREAVLQTIRYGVNQDYPQSRKAVMPAWGDHLSEDQIKMLAVRVYSFGGGK